MNAGEFFLNLIKTVPYKLHKELRDNGIEFKNHAHHNHGFIDIFERIFKGHAIEHRKTKVKHPWTNGQVEGMNRTLKEGTVNTFTYKSPKELEEHLGAYLELYNFVKRLKTLKGKSPWEFIVNEWKENPAYFNRAPHHNFTEPSIF